MLRLLKTIRFTSRKKMLDDQPVRSFLFSSSLLLLFLLPGCYSSSRPSRIGTIAPDFTVQDSDRKVTLSQFRGNIVVLNFWATWCPPCVEELPSLMAMQTRMKAKGVIVLSVSIDVDSDFYHRFLWLSRALRTLRFSGGPHRNGSAAPAHPNPGV
jgi:thiol-disulfide isomerase/thioredoxin